MEWLYWKEAQMRESKPGFNIDHYFKNGEKRLLDESYGQVFLDGFAIFDGTSYAFEYNGCRYHYCAHCGANPEKQAEEERRQRTEIPIFFSFFEREFHYASLYRFINSKVDVLEVKTSCQWNLEKVNYGNLKPELFKYHNQRLRTDEIQEEIIDDRLFGLTKIDIYIPHEKRKKWENLNFPPIIAKRSLQENEISEEMLQSLRRQNRKFPLGTTFFHFFFYKIILKNHNL